MNRRAAIRLGAGALALWACDSSTAPTANYPQGRLRARPREPIDELPAGLAPLGLAPARDGVIFVPAGDPPGRGWPLGVLLHGSGGDSSYFEPYLPIAQELRLVLLIPESRFGSWDAQDYRADTEFIDRALLRTFARARIDPARTGIGGFSAGGAYALTLGLANGDLFRDVFAVAPARLTTLQRHGTPSFYIAHGMSDTSVPVTVSRVEIVPELRDRGYQVDYHEFAGGHVVPPAILRTALARI